jgi:hypothetical protein
MYDQIFLILENLNEFCLLVIESLIWLQEIIIFKTDLALM